MKRVPLIAILFVFAGCAEGEFGKDVDNNLDSSNPTKDMGGPKRDRGMKGVDLKGMICQPGSATCGGENTIKTCLSDGLSFQSTPCPSEQICEMGVCKMPPICNPGTKKCSDPNTISSCRASGEAWVATSCSANQGCVNGACLPGKPDGTQCATNDECASSTCHCGSEEQCAFTQSGFCVSKGCDQCAENAFCFDGQKMLAGRINGYDFCLQTCDKVCEDPSQKCYELPSKTGFNQGCYFGSLNAIGGDCSSADDCVGGVCRRDYFRESNLCTRACDENSPCPDGTGCVDLNGFFQCTLLCGDGSAIGTQPCPLDLPEDRFDVTCKNRATASGGVLRVCVVP